MFFEKFANYNDKVEQSCVDDYKILSESIIKKYNIPSIQQRLIYELSEIEEKQMIYDTCDSLSKNQDSIFTNNPSYISNKVESDGFKRVNISLELDEKYEKYRYVFDNKFSNIEKCLFMQLYIYKRSGNSIRRLLHIAYPKYQTINNSIIIKIGSFLGWEETKI
jgi:hypothetical protein